MATKSDKLRKAAQAKQDEFYTQLEDVENELRHYRQHFQDKVVLCNCDDPYESNFFKYFAMNFNYLGLKKLIATCYVSSPVMGTQISLFDDMEYDIKAPRDPNKKPYKVEITQVVDENGDGAFDLEDIKHLLKCKKNVCKELKGDGDFRSPECIELLKEADIIVTNPPFSLFREYVALLVEYNKKFVIIGNQNAIAYKEIFPLLKENKMWIGYKFGDMSFRVPHYYEPRETRYWVDETGQKWRSFGNICWFTNLDIDKRHEDLVLYRTYSSEEYPHYDNYDAIEVSRVSDIPNDYYGVMGVPITFLDKYNPEQFEILGLAHGLLSHELNISPIGKEWCDLYFSQGNKGHYSPSMRELVAVINGKAVSFYNRLIIKRRETAI